jgi:GntR family transcriptional regulator, carbon starvation induced regulator
VQVAEAKSMTLASTAYNRLRDDIIQGRFRPGEKLRIRAICDAYDIGPSPIREALNRLVSDRLIDQADQRGFRVQPITLQSLDELIMARCWANEMALRNSIGSGGLDWEEGVAAALDELERTPRYIDEDDVRNPAWETVHEEFHAALIAASGSSWIEDFCTQMFVAAERYRLAARNASHKQRPDLDEHRAIAEAALARRTEKAVDLLNAHFRLTAHLVRTQMREAGL